MDCSDVSNASSYGVQVSPNANFTTLVVNQSELTNSEFSVGSGILSNNTTYFCRANAANGLGTSPFSLIWFFTTGTVGIINTGEIPVKFNLYQNYPNPFNPLTKIRFDLPADAEAASVIITVYDINGSVVKELINMPYKAGSWEIEFNAIDYPSGVYFYRLQTEKYSDTKKLMLLK